MMVRDLGGGCKGKREANCVMKLLEEGGLISIEQQSALPAAGDTRQPLRNTGLWLSAGYTH